MIKSSDTKPPDFMMPSAFLPNSVPSLIAARSISPVEICGISYSFDMNCAWVPLPAPGGPNKIIRIIVVILLSCVDE